jgi:hypothetical protein
LTALALAFIAIWIAVIGAWDIFTEARSQTPAPQEQMFPAELSTAIEAQRQISANEELTEETNARLLVSPDRRIPQELTRAKSS